MWILMGLRDGMAILGVLWCISALTGDDQRRPEPIQAPLPLGCRTIKSDQLIEFSLKVLAAGIPVAIDECWEVQP
jgi:hypothetical protein